MPGGAATNVGRSGPRIIIDTDLSRWWDDASTIGMANVLHRRGKLRILGIVSDVPNTVAVAAIDAIDTAYGHGDIPLGAVAGSEADTFDHGYTDELVKRLPHSVRRRHDVPNAVALYRRLLARQPDHSVTIVSVGGYTNLAGLLESKRGQGSSLDGRALAGKKVKRLVNMDGIFPGGGPAFTNQKIDLAAASVVVGGRGMADTDGLGRRPRWCPDPGRRRPVRRGAGPSDAHRVRGALRVRAAQGRGLGCADAAVRDRRSSGRLHRGGSGRRRGHQRAGGLSWATPSTRPRDVYVHVVDQPTLDTRIDELLAVG